MNPNEYCQQKAAKSGSSFYYSFRFLPFEKRQAITALYAFCREVDDIVDECSDPQLAQTKLNWWRNEIKVAFAGQPQHPVTQALAPAIKRYQLPLAEFDEIISGMEMDLTQHRYQNFEALQLYCYRVAGVVGQLSARIFGYQSSQTLNYAHDLGIAFQLTNIIRDVGEDARRNRIYLPVDELKQFNVPAQDILKYQETDAFRQLMLFQVERAERYYQQAFEQLPSIDRKTQRPGLLMAAIYRTLLSEIKSDGVEKVLNQRTSLTPIRKLWIAWKTWWQN